jgi:hypothetical protein
MLSSRLMVGFDQLTVLVNCLFSMIQLLWLVSSVGGTHFRGGYISWTAVSPSVTNTSTVTIAIRQTYSWANSVIPCGQLIGDASFLQCVSANCTNYLNNVSVRVPCISFDLGLDVSTGSGETSLSLLAGSQIVTYDGNFDFATKST